MMDKVMSAREFVMDGDLYMTYVVRVDGLENELTSSMWDDYGYIGIDRVMVDEIHAESGVIDDDVVKTYDKCWDLVNDYDANRASKEA